MLDDIEACRETAAPENICSQICATYGECFAGDEAEVSAYAEACQVACEEKRSKW